MYRIQENKTALRSQRMIADSLFRLMERKPFQEITVTELCEEAQVGRKTFYRNFDRKEDVIDFQLDLLCAEHQQKLRGHDSDAQLRIHLTFIQANARKFILLYRNGFHQYTSEKFRMLLPQTMPSWSADPVRQEYCSRYIVAGIGAVNRAWIERGFRESIDEVIDMIHRIQSGLYGKEERV